MATITTQVLLSLFAQCATDVAPETLHTLIGVESSRNPYAIAVVYDKSTPQKDRLEFAQPTTEEEAKNIITALESPPITHKSYSVGLMQVNSSNFKTYGITKENMFNACKNIEAGAGIFKACYADVKNNNLTADLEKLTKNRLTLKEALESTDFNLMAKQRLKRVFNDIYAQLDQIYDNAENTAVLEA